MNSYPKPGKAAIVYFSGTGGTRKTALQFEKTLQDKQISVITYEISCRNAYTPLKADILLMIYPVYAMNAPRPVYEFIEKLPINHGCPAAVISVSGGGEITPNTASRLHCIRRLEKRGFHVVYENMIVMPSNVFIPTPEELSVRLLEILPDKVEHICNDLLKGVIRRTKPDFINRMISRVGELEKTRIGGRFFGRHIKVGKRCKGCGICRKGCPTGNIKLNNGRPVFDHKCCICLKCIYSCPNKALTPAIGNFIILKQGYRLND